MQRRGFSLFEILIAMSLASIILISIIYFVSAAFEARRSAIRLNTAVFLAENLMNRIKSKKDTSSDSGEFENFPDFSYEYEIEDIEWDPTSLEGVGESGASQDDLSSQLAEYRDEAGLQTEIKSGIVIRLKKYSVKVMYDNGKEFELVFHKGFDIANVTAQ